MRIHTTTEDATPLARLATQVDRIERELAGLESLRIDIAHHGSALRRLAEATRTQATAARVGAGKPSGEEGGPPEWVTVTDPQTAVGWLNEAWMWVERVWSHYRPIPPCWPWHPSAVAELLACRQSWLAVTTTGASADGLSNWHDRWRPGAEHRLAKTLSACARIEGEHVDGATRWTADPAGLDELAVWWATTHGATPAPGLTPLGTARP